VCIVLNCLPLSSKRPLTISERL